MLNPYSWLDELKVKDVMEWKLMWQIFTVIRISEQPSPLLIMIDQKQQESVEYFKYLDSVVTNDVRCICKSKSRVAIRKSGVQQGDYIHE